MRVGIDISQIVYQGTGVASYTKNLVENLLKIDQENEYVLFFSSLRKSLTQISDLKSPNHNFKLKTFKLPPRLLDLLWNRLHIMPIEWFIGPVDVFFSSDWTQPPTLKAKKVTTIHDLSIFKFPKEHHPRIVATQKRRLRWVKKESDLVMCDSEATKEDVIKILGIKEERLRVVYPGGTVVMPNLFRNLHGLDPEMSSGCSLFASRIASSG